MDRIATALVALVLVLGGATAGYALGWADGHDERPYQVEPCPPEHELVELNQDGGFTYYVCFDLTGRTQ